jgi:hypothetical protein
MTERYVHFAPAYLHGEMDALMRFQPATVAPRSEETAAPVVTRLPNACATVATAMLRASKSRDPSGLNLTSLERL